MPKFVYLTGASAHEWDFSILEDATARLAGEIVRTSHESRPQGRIAILAPNHPVFWTAFLAAARLGMGFVPLSDKAPAERSEWMIQDAEVSILLAEPDLIRGFELPPNVRLLEIETVEPMQPSFQNAPPFAGRLQGTGLNLLYTSGTGAHPRAVLRHAEADRKRIEQNIRMYGLLRSDVHLVAGPLAHSGPLFFARTHTAVGSDMVVMRRFDAEAACRAMDDYSVTTVFLVPTMWRALRRAVADRSSPRSLRVAWTAGAPMPAEEKVDLAQWLGGNALWEFYGATETGTMGVATPKDVLEHPSSVGFPPEGVEVRILDADGQRLPAGSTGEIWVKSETSMAGYRDRPHRTAPGFPGAITVEDIGWLDGEGRIYVVERSGDMVITGGINVYPSVVEAALMRLPGIVDAAAFGLPDPFWGQRLEAAVVVDAAAGLTQVAILDQIRPHLAPAEVPKQIHFWDALPRSAAGKTLRKAAAVQATQANEG